MPKAIELNTSLGTRYIVMASNGRVEGLDEWKKVADTLAAAVDPMKKAGLQPGYHNHQAEFREIDGKRSIGVCGLSRARLAYSIFPE